MKHQNIPRSGESGFTLIEIMLVLIISGVFLIAAAQALKVYTINAQYEKTIDHAEVVQEMLFEYFGREGAYPCPANPTLGPNDPNYGMQQCRSAADFLADRDNCNNMPAGIVCPDPATSEARDVDGDGISDIVVIGIIPFRELSEYIDNLDGNILTSEFRELHKADGYNTIFTYAVTESLTQANPENTILTPARPFDGAVAIEDENEETLTDPYGSAHYVLISHGDNGRGGYTRQGRLIDDCNIAVLPGGEQDGDGDGLPGGDLDVELENCNFDDAVFLKGARSIQSGSDYFDDLVFFKASAFVPIWQSSLASPAGESYIYNSNEGNAGVGTDTPNEKLHVMGNVLGEGMVNATEYCDGQSDSCFNADDIGGEGSDCPEGQVAYGISDGSLVCTELTWQVPTVDCPIIDGQQTYLHAISNTGRITCCFEDGTACTVYP